MTGFAPCLASSNTMAMPMPLLPPVTIATLPFRLMRFSLPWYSSRCGLFLCAVTVPDSEHPGEKKLRHDWSKYGGAQHQHENCVQNTLIDEAMSAWIECFEAYKGRSQCGSHLTVRRAACGYLKRRPEISAATNLPITSAMTIDRARAKLSIRLR